MSSIQNFRVVANREGEANGENSVIQWKTVSSGVQKETLRVQAVEDYEKKKHTMLVNAPIEEEGGNDVNRNQ